MYTRFFHLKQAPFSIAPDPRYLYMSERHREALAHLLYGVKGGGGFVLLTGEIGAGKTTVCRCFLNQVPAGCNVGYIFNPKLTVIELLQSICDEFHIPAPEGNAQTASVKEYVDRLNDYLLSTHAKNQNNVLVIDEAQNLSPDVLEQLRLLTNLETDERKLLQIILIGQPGLRDMLALPSLEQLAQRVIARYHLAPLSESETAHYILHRLTVAGAMLIAPFPMRQMKKIHQLTGGIPRRINLLCDRALLGAYAEGKHEVDSRIIDKAAAEVLETGSPSFSVSARTRWQYVALGVLALATVAGTAAWTLNRSPTLDVKSAASGKAVNHVAATPAAATLDGRHAFDASERERALHDLAKLWHVSLAAGPACETAPSKTLRCYSDNHTDLDELSELNRPAVLSLYNDAGDRHYAILVSMSKTDATLSIDGARMSMPVTELRKRIKDGFTTFWQIHSDFREPILMGDSGPEVDWIAARLARAHGMPPPAAGHVFDRDMMNQVREFQATHGIEADGVVGPRTFMHLNRVADTAEPRLWPVAASSIASKE